MNPQQPQSQAQPIPNQPTQATPQVTNPIPQQSQPAMQPQNPQPYQAIPAAPELQNNQIVHQDNPSSTQSSLLISGLRF